MPCNMAFHPSENSVYLADCYGSSYIHKFSTEDGRYLNLSFGGWGDEKGEYLTPHGLIYDERKNLMAIADRSNSRIQYVDFEGKTQEIITGPDINEPCDFDILGEYMLIPDLGGYLLVLDENNKTLSKIDVASVMAEQGLKHPHDAIFMSNFDIVVGSWDPGTLSYWERVQDWI